MAHVSTANVLTRVFKLEANYSVGTAFTIEVEDQQYLVTARHVLPDVGVEAAIRLTGHAGVREIGATPLPGVSDEVDIAVVKLDEDVSRRLPLEPSLDGIGWGQQVFFYGFPYGLASTARGAERLPLVKQALLSGMTHSDSGVHMLYLDGFNNPGFSGGPVVFIPVGKEGPLRVGGVVSGYRIDPLDVRDGESSEALGTFVQANSGIMVAYSISHALDALAVP